MHLFRGQGVKHITEGYGTVSRIPLVRRKYLDGTVVYVQAPRIRVKFAHGEVEVSATACLEAAMPDAERKQMEDRIKDYPEQRNSRVLIAVEDTITVGRATANPVPLTPVIIPASGEGRVNNDGFKCGHGNYMPAPFVSGGTAPGCSLCHPYEIVARDNAQFKA